MNLLKEFKEFAIKGNAIDLAVGVIIAGAFNKIVTSVIEDLITPIIGACTRHGVDFSNLYVPLSKKGIEELAKGQDMSVAKAKEFGAVLTYGNFITICMNFLIQAFCVFMIVKVIARLKKSPPSAQAPAVPPAQEVLLTEIRDLLKAQAK